MTSPILKLKSPASSALDKFRAPLKSNLRWWKVPKGDPTLGPTTFEAGHTAFNQQMGRRQYLWDAALLYGSMQPTMSAVLGPITYARQLSGLRGNNRQKIRLNIIRRVIDAAVAQITRTDVRPLHLPTGGDWALQRKARKLNRFSDGQARKHKLRVVGPDVFRDSCIFDMGAAKVFSRNDEPVVERVLGLELAWDLRDARYGHPQQLWQRRWYDIDGLIDEWPEFEDEIRSARDGDADVEVPSALVNQVEVIEAWILPGKNRPGRHVIALSNAALLDEEWDRPRFPFSFLTYSNPIAGGPSGQGIEYHLRGIQTEINTTLRSIQQALYMAAVPRVLAPRSAKVMPAAINNEILSIIEFDGPVPPQFHSGAAFPPELLHHLTMLVGEAFAQEGVSQAGAQSQKSAGLTSGAAIRTERDLSTERFSKSAKAYEQWYLDTDELLLDEARALTKGGKKVFVLVPGKRVAENLEFKDVDIDRNRYNLDTWPTNLLPATPEGRLQTVQDMLQAGMLDVTEGRRLLEFPDLESVTGLENAPSEDIFAEVDRLLDGESYRPPEPYQSLDLGVKVFQWSYLKARQDGAPEDVLENIRLWIEEAQAMLAKAAPAPGAAPGGPPQPSDGTAAPLGKPAAAPTSSLLPTGP